MAYLALYRQWRPKTFARIAGQEHITRTLHNAVLTGRVAHAYCFCGPRGTGKTSTARVLAAALNCLDPQQGEPCGRCASCRDIEAGSALDVLEIDAASHRGIDEVRELREKVRLSPALGRYRVFIIDEVHMLTGEAFNALLKTLEEPPGHVVFILATTEAHKVPLTILSRCQRFDFHRLDDAVVAQRLQEVAAKAGLEMEPAALKLIVRAAGGGMRDALAVLDQLAAYSAGVIRESDVRDLLGSVGPEVLAEMARALLAGDAAAVLQQVEQAYRQGRDLALLLADLCAYLREMWLAALRDGSLPGGGGQFGNKVRSGEGPGAPAAGGLAAGSGEAGPDAAARLPRLMRVLETLARAQQEMRFSPSPRLLLEMALVQAALDAPAPGEELERRVQRLELQLSRLGEALRRLAGGRDGGAEFVPSAPTAPVAQPEGRNTAGDGMPAGVVPVGEALPPAVEAVTRPRTKGAAAAGGPVARQIPPPAGQPAGPGESGPAERPQSPRAITLADVQLVWDNFLAALRQQKKDILVEFMERFGVQPFAVQDGVLHLAWAAEPPSFVRNTMEEGAQTLGDVLGRLLRVKISIKFGSGSGTPAGGRGFAPGGAGMAAASGPGHGGGHGSSGPSRPAPGVGGRPVASPLEEASRLFGVEEVGEVEEDPFAD
ncbi:MAG: DNA polymerase III subunit gamma/tau [Bacillota bacterium]